MGFRRLIFAALLVIPSFLGAIPAEIYSDDFYLRLGAYPNASYEEIMDAAERLMSAQRAKIVGINAKPDGYYKIREAYVTLSNPDKRRGYDQSHGIQNRYEGAPPKNWEIRIEDFCEENDPSSTYEIVEETPPVELLEGRPEPPPFQKPSEFLDELEEGKVSTAKFGRTAILVRDRSYLDFLEDARESFYLEGRRPHILDELFEAHLRRAASVTFPGTILGAIAFPIGLFGVFVGPALAALEIAWKIYEVKKRTPRSLRHLRSFLKDTRQSLIKAKDDRVHYTKLANDLILIDLWLETLFPALLTKPENRDFSNPQNHYPYLYQSRFPLWQITLRFVKAYPELAPALLFRFLQDRPDTLFLEAAMREDSQFWIGAAKELQLVFREQKQGELSAEDAALEKVVSRLMKAEKNLVARAGAAMIQAPKQCAKYLIHVGFVTKSLLKTPDGYL